MGETYSGTVVSIGAKEMSKDGTKEKPRKVIVTDSPDYQGKTFRCWYDSEPFRVIADAWNNGEVVHIAYDINPIPGTDYKQNMVTAATTNGDGAAWQQAGTPNWGQTESDPTDSAQQPAASTQRTIKPDHNSNEAKEKYWAEREAKDAQRTLEIEAAWGIQTALQVLDTDDRKPNKVQEVALQMVMLKRAVAKELAQ